MDTGSNHSGHLIEAQGVPLAVIAAKGRSLSAQRPENAGALRTGHVMDHAPIGGRVEGVLDAGFHIAAIRIAFTA